MVAALSVRPSPLMMGVTEVDQPVTATWSFRAGRRSASSPSDRATTASSARRRPIARSVHVLPVTFSAKQGSESGGSVKAKIRIETDLPGANAVEVDVSVQTQAGSSHKTVEIAGPIAAGWGLSRFLWQDATRMGLSPSAPRRSKYPNVPNNGDD